MKTLTRKKVWKLRSPQPELRRTIATDLAITEITAQIMINRGVSTTEQAREYIRCDLETLPSPFLLKGMQSAVERISLALKRPEKMAIYGDFDADGMTSASILKIFFREIGHDVPIYTPNRLSDGYGINLESVKKLQESGVSLIITVDSGISALEPVAWGKANGLDFVITDHHLPGRELPEAAAIVNPRQVDCPYPYKGLAGVGVAFNLLIALRAHLRDNNIMPASRLPNLKRYLDIVSIGTIADIVPITAVNRVLVRHGLVELGQAERVGIAALKNICKLNRKSVSSHDVAFALAPRLNAVGRLGETGLALNLLTAETAEQANNLAKKLDAFNDRRKELEVQIFDECRREIESRPEFLERHSIVLARENWHPGVIGIVASRLADAYIKPAVVISLTGDTGRGSARSIDGFHLHEGLRECESLLLAYGGHRGAAGLKLRRDKIREFTAAFDQVVTKNTLAEDFVLSLDVDMEIEPDLLSAKLLDEINELLSPFGEENSRPVFQAKGLTVESFSINGGKHLRLKVSKHNHAIAAIGFNMAPVDIAVGMTIDAVFKPVINEWQGMKYVEFQLLDFATTV